MSAGDFEQQQVVSKSPILEQDNKPEVHVERLPSPPIHVEAKQQKKKKVTP